MKKTLLTSLAATALVALSAQAALVVYEPFDYTAGTSVTSSTTPGSPTLVATDADGLTGDWTLTHNNSATLVTSTIQDGTNFSTAFPLSGVSGGKVAFTATGNNNNPTLGANFATGAVDALRPDVNSSITIWVSVLVETNANIMLSLNSVNGRTFGMNYNAGSGALSLIPTTTFPDAGNVSIPVGSRPGASPFMLVGKIELSRTETQYVADIGSAQAWLVNSTADLASITDESSLTAAAAGTIVNTAVMFAPSNNRAVNQVTLRPGLNGATANSQFDEIRVGTSLADVVVAVPEPAHYAAAFAAVMGLLVWLRRRK